MICDDSRIRYYANVVLHNFTYPDKNLNPETRVPAISRQRMCVVNVPVPFVNET